VSEDGTLLSDEDIQEEVDTFMFAVSIYHFKQKYAKINKLNLIYDLILFLYFLIILCVFFFFYQGVDTTSVTLSWVMYVLGKYPHVQDKIVAELNEKVPNFGDGKLTLDILRSLDYLGRTIKEVLRLYPSVPFIGRQIYKPLKIGNKIINI